MTNNSHAPKESDNSENPDSQVMSFRWFLVLAVIAFLMPFLVIPLFGVYWGAATAIVVFMLWIYLMPTTCMNGGLICSFVATMLLVNTICMVVFSVIRFLGTA
jgi:hypothetical protein